MAKKKSGFAGMDYGQIMMQQAVKQATEPVYCRYCGRDIRQADKNSSNSGTGYTSDWEIKNNAHENCYRSSMRQRR